MEQGFGRREASGGPVPSRCGRRIPANKLSYTERETILSVCSQPELPSRPASQTMPRLTDNGEYLAAESSFYRMLREAHEVTRQERAQAPRTIAKLEGFQAAGPNQVWCIRTAHLSESSFATIRHLTQRKGCLSRDGIRHRMFQLG